MDKEKFTTEVFRYHHNAMERFNFTKYYLRLSEYNKLIKPISIFDAVSNIVNLKEAYRKMPDSQVKSRIQLFLKQFNRKQILKEKKKMEKLLTELSDEDLSQMQYLPEGEQFYPPQGFFYINP